MKELLFRASEQIVKEDSEQPGEETCVAMKLLDKLWL